MLAGFLLVVAAFAAGSGSSSGGGDGGLSGKTCAQDYAACRDDAGKIGHLLDP